MEHRALLPYLNPQLGEPVIEEASAAGLGVLGKQVRQYPPQQYTVTIWVYPEKPSKLSACFGLSYIRLGTAVQPGSLPAGVPIAGSSVAANPRHNRRESSAREAQQWL